MFFFLLDLPLQHQQKSGILTAAHFSHSPTHSLTHPRQAAQDDIIPFSIPFSSSSSDNTSLVIAKGTVITSPIRALNRSSALWGPNAKEFVPERWLDDMSGVVGCKAKEIVGHKHILTFSDGPRTCLGKGFASANFKVCSFFFLKLC